VARKSFATHYGGHGHGAHSAEQRSVRRDRRALREWRRTGRLSGARPQLYRERTRQGGGGGNGCGVLSAWSPRPEQVSLVEAFG